MEISGVLVQYLLGEHKYRNCHFDFRKIYCGLSIPAADPELMKADIIYVCLLSEALALQKQQSGMSYICIQDRVLEEGETDHFTDIILIQENIRLGDLYNIVTRAYSALQTWDERSKAAIIGGCRYQKLLDLAEQIIREPVYIVDSTFKLLANTKNYSSPDPINVSLEKYGYHTDETIEILKKNHRLELYSQETDFIINDPGFTQFPTITKCFNVSGKTEVIVVLVCTSKKLTEPLKELFRILTNYLNICFNSGRRRISPRISPQDLLLYKLTYEDENTPFIVAERARSSSFPITGRFVLFRIMYDSEPNVLIDKALDHFKSLLPGEHFFSHNYEITMVSVLKDRNTSARITELTNALVPSLKEQNMICGISPVFENLYEIKQASVNATTALSFGSKFCRRGNFCNIPEDLWHIFSRTVTERIFSYDDLSEYICISSYLSTHIELDTEALRFLRTLQQHDQKHHSSLLLILLVYLMSGNRATDAGYALHMHRNNVVYSINKIQEIFSIDLNDSILCEKLKYSFRVLAVEHADKDEVRTHLL